MDAQLLFVSGVVVVLLALIIYLIFVFGTKERTYEEIIEEQRRKQMESRGKTTGESDKKKDRKQKKVKKSKSEKAHATGDAGQTQEEETEEQPPRMLNIELDPEIIEPCSVSKNTSEVRHRKKVKPILHNRDEVSPVAADLEVKEKFHPKHAPKDDVEVKHERERKMSGGSLPRTDDEQAPQPAKSSKKSKKTKEAAQEPIVVKEVVQSQAAPLAQAEPAKKSLKKGKSLVAAEAKKGSEDVQMVLSFVEGAGLRDVDLQKVVEALRAKQDSVPEDWTKKSLKGDPVPVLKKQLQDTEKILKDEQERAQSASDQVRQLRQQLQQQEQSTVSKMSQKDKEMDALQQRMNTSSQQSLNEVAALQGQLAKAGEEIKQLRAAKSVRQSQPTTDSNLQTQLKIMSAEMAKTAQQMAEKDGMIGMLQNGKASLEQKLQEATKQNHELSSQVQQSQNQQSSRQFQDTRTQLEQVQHELQKLKREYEAKEQELEVAKRDAAMKETEVQHAESETKMMKEELQKQKVERASEYGIMESRMTEVERRVEDKERKLEELRLKLACSEKAQDDQTTQIKDLRQQNSQLEAEFKKTSEKHQQHPVQQEDLLKQVEEKDTAVRRLENELLRKQEDASKLLAELQAQQKKSSDHASELESTLQRKQQELDDTMSKHSSKQSEQVQGLQQQVLQLQAECATLKEISKQSADAEKQLAVLQQQLSMTRKENDELRQKNTKAMDALARLEKVAQEKVGENKASSCDSALEDARTSNAKLQSQVQHYKTVLADTEGILNRLQTSVETEEKKWHAKMRIYEQELQTARTELNKMKAERAGDAEKIQNGTGSSIDEADEAASAVTEAAH